MRSPRLAEAGARRGNRVEKLGEALFTLALRETDDGASEHYYQVVISASRDVLERGQEETIRVVVDELAAVATDTTRLGLDPTQVVDALLATLASL